MLRFLRDYELIDIGIGLTRALSSFIIASKTKSVDACGGKQKDILYIEAPNFAQAAFIVEIYIYSLKTKIIFFTRSTAPFCAIP